MRMTIMCWVPLTRTPPRAAPLLGTARKGTPQHDSIQRNERCSARVALGPKRGPRPDAARPPDLNLDGPVWTRIYMYVYGFAHAGHGGNYLHRLQRAGGRTRVGKRYAEECICKRRSANRDCANYGVWPLARLMYERSPWPVQRNAAAPSNASSGATRNYSADNAAAPSDASSGAAKVAT
jgi:hypothetical protein